MFRAVLCSSSGGQICVITASGIVTLCKRLYSMPVESVLQMARSYLWALSIEFACYLPGAENL